MPPPSTPSLQLHYVIAHCPEVASSPSFTHHYGRVVGSAALKDGARLHAFASSWPALRMAADLRLEDHFQVPADFLGELTTAITVTRDSPRAYQDAANSISALPPPCRYATTTALRVTGPRVRVPRQLLQHILGVMVATPSQVEVTGARCGFEAQFPSVAAATWFRQHEMTADSVVWMTVLGPVTLTMTTTPTDPNRPQCTFLPPSTFLTARRPLASSTLDRVWPELVTPDYHGQYQCLVVESRADVARMITRHHEAHLSFTLIISDASLLAVIGARMRASTLLPLHSSCKPVWPAGRQWTAATPTVVHILPARAARASRQVEDRPLSSEVEEYITLAAAQLNSANRVWSDWLPPLAAPLPASASVYARALCAATSITASLVFMANAVAAARSNLRTAAFPSATPPSTPAHILRVHQRRMMYEVRSPGRSGLLPDYDTLAIGAALVLTREEDGPECHLVASFRGDCVSPSAAFALLWAHVNTARAGTLGAPPIELIAQPSLPPSLPLPPSVAERIPELPAWSAGEHCRAILACTSSTPVAFEKWCSSTRVHLQASPAPSLWFRALGGEAASPVVVDPPRADSNPSAAAAGAGDSLQVPAACRGDLPVTLVDQSPTTPSPYAPPSVDAPALLTAAASAREGRHGAQTVAASTPAELSVEAAPADGSDRARSATCEPEVTLESAAAVAQTAAAALTCAAHATGETPTAAALGERPDASMTDAANSSDSARTAMSEPKETLEPAAAAAQAAVGALACAAQATGEPSNAVALGERPDASMTDAAAPAVGAQSKLSASTAASSEQKREEQLPARTELTDTATAARAEDRFQPTSTDATMSDLQADTSSEVEISAPQAAGAASTASPADAAAALVSSGTAREISAPPSVPLPSLRGTVSNNIHSSPSSPAGQLNTADQPSPRRSLPKRHMGPREVVIDVDSTVTPSPTSPVPLGEETVYPSTGSESEEEGAGTDSVLPPPPTDWPEVLTDSEESAECHRRATPKHVMPRSRRAPKGRKYGVRVRPYSVIAGVKDPPDTVLQELAAHFIAAQHPPFCLLPKQRELCFYGTLLFACTQKAFLYPAKFGTLLNEIDVITGPDSPPLEYSLRFTDHNALSTRFSEFFDALAVDNDAPTASVQAYMDGCCRLQSLVEGEYPPSERWLQFYVNYGLHVSTGTLYEMSPAEEGGSDDSAYANIYLADLFNTGLMSLLHREDEAAVLGVVGAGGTSMSPPIHADKVWFEAPGEARCRGIVQRINGAPTVIREMKRAPGARERRSFPMALYRGRYLPPLPIKRSTR